MRKHHYLLLLMLLFLIYIKDYNIDASKLSINISLIIMSIWIVVGFIVDFVDLFINKFKWLKRKIKDYYSPYNPESR